ncbi:hypothetical protein B0H21DRAFT_699319 [Amylocystis lapponica]|nr:hypothetical protein B0H21DRAFT_699319 [Amylocystis lapponica]
METHRGAGRGSYIWGRSVHNTRIERLWYDVTHAFGQKWKNFFLDLETNHGLDPRLPSHIWLLHFLFLSSINDDAQEFVNAWNSHPLHIRRERQRSPRDMWLFSMLQDGPRGLASVLEVEDELQLEDLASFGVDWEAAADPTLMAHLLEHNPDEHLDSNPFAVGPSSLSHVPCDPPESPLTHDAMEYVRRELALRVNIYTSSMDIRRIVWQQALALCSSLHLLA